MGSILPFPSPRPSFTPHALAKAATQPVRLHRNSYWTVDQLADRLALANLARRTIIDRLRHLARHAGLPLPRNPRIWQGQMQTGADSICAASLWDRGEILAWLDNGSPASGTAAPTPAPSPALRSELRERALRLATGAGQ